MLRCSKSDFEEVGFSCGNPIYGQTDGQTARLQYRGPAHGIYFGYFPDISVWPAAMFEGSNVQWRLGKIAFHIADKLRRQLTRQG